MNFLFSNVSLIANINFNRYHNIASGILVLVSFNVLIN